jgi:hypothetical protein
MVEEKTEILASTAVMPRLDRGIQYAEASRFNHYCLWNTGSPGPGAQLRTGRAMTIEGVAAPPGDSGLLRSQ